MKFQKGEGGRPKGCQNKVTRDIRELAGRLFDAEYWRETKKRLKAGALNPAIEKVLLAYAYGEPMKTVHLKGDISVEEKRGVLRHLPESVVEELAARAVFDPDDDENGTVQ